MAGFKEHFSSVGIRSAFTCNLTANIYQHDISITFNLNLQSATTNKFFFIYQQHAVNFHLRQFNTVDTCRWDGCEFNSILNIYYEISSNLQAQKKSSAWISICLFGNKINEFEFFLYFLFSDLLSRAKNSVRDDMLIAFT